jgi:hypothetical protein
MNAKGRNDERVGSDRVLIIRRSLYHAPHVAALSTSGRALMIELQSMYNGTNNGVLFLSVRDAADRLGFTDLEAASRAFAELESVGLITVTIEGSFAMKAGEVSRARALRLNWIGEDGKTVSADKLEPLDFSRLSAKQKRRIAKRSAALERYLKEQQTISAVRETRTLMADSVRETRTLAAESVRETRTLEAGNGGNPSPAIVRETLTHIEHHIPGGVFGQDQAIESPQIASGPSEPLDGSAAEAAMRDKITDHWTKLDRQARTAWASGSGLSLQELRDFVIGGAHIPFPKQVALRSAANSRVAGR